MEETLRERVRASGYKMTYLAKQLGITKEYMYMCLAGKRNMDIWKQKALKEILGDQ